MGYQYVDDCLLKGSCNIGDIYGNALHPARVEVVEDSRFHTAETEIIAGTRNLSAGKDNGMRVSLPGGLVDLGAAGVSQADLTGNLVKGFACSVILCPSQDLVYAVVTDQDQVGMSARYDQAGKRRLQRRIRNIVGADMALDVVHPDQGDPGRKAQSLCCGNTDQERAHQTGPVGHRDGIHFLKGPAGFLK